MTIIKLTEVSGNTIYVNADNISCIADYGIVLIGYDGVLKVKETPKQIVNQLEELYAEN